MHRKGVGALAPTFKDKQNRASAPEEFYSSSLGHLGMAFSKGINIAISQHRRKLKRCSDA
jgi:hypothetical protein